MVRIYYFHNMLALRCWCAEYVDYDYDYDYGSDYKFDYDYDYDYDYL